MRHFKLITPLATVTISVDSPANMIRHLALSDEAITTNVAKIHDYKLECEYHELVDSLGYMRQYIVLDGDMYSIHTCDGDFIIVRHITRAFMFNRIIERIEKQEPNERLTVDEYYSRLNIGTKMRPINCETINGTLVREGVELLAMKDYVVVRMLT